MYGPRRLYESPDRHYHNWDHVRYCLDLLVDISDRLPLTWYTPLRWALIYHDAIYDTHANDNEERSARLAMTELCVEGLHDDDMDKIDRLIRITQHHDPAEGDRIGEVMCDIDCAILGASPDEYQDYANGVRMEYGWVSDADWRSGRAAVLFDFLARPKIFRSPYFEHLEEPARQNIARELDFLR